MLWLRPFYPAGRSNQNAKIAKTKTSLSEKKKGRIPESFQSSSSAQIHLSLCFMEIKCQNWLTGFHQSLSSDLALRLLTFMQRWRQTVFGDWCHIAPGARATANQRFFKIAGILIHISSVECAILTEHRIKDKEQKAKIRIGMNICIMCHIEAYIIFHTCAVINAGNWKT